MKTKYKIILVVLSLVIAAGLAYLICFISGGISSVSKLTSDDINELVDGVFDREAMQEIAENITDNLLGVKIRVSDGSAFADSKSIASAEKYNCIAVDSQENVYLSDKSHILVINCSGEEIGLIEVESKGKAFIFDIVDDYIYLSTSWGYMMTDLSGENQYKRISPEIKKELDARNTYVCTAASGARYCLYNDHVYREKAGASSYEPIY